MTGLELKEYIFNNCKIEYVLNEIGCHHIKYNKNKEYFTCGNIDGDNPSCIVVNNNKYINVRNYTREEYFKSNDEIKSDIFTLIQYNFSRTNQNFDFREAIKYVHKLFDIPLTYNKDAEVKKQFNDPLEVFKKIKRSTVYVQDIELDEMENIDYIPYIHINWFREGIVPQTIKKFGLAYSHLYKRNIIPLRYWLDGKLLGYNQRTVIDNYEELGIKKYFITPTYPKSHNLYGLWENKEDITKYGYVVVYESEKSVLKRHSRKDPTGVALSGHTLSSEQARILIGLNVDIVISLDKDISINEIRHMCEKFYGIRNVYYTYDKYNLLNPKDSIADKSSNIFEFLMKYKIKYDEEEHKKYLDSLKDKN